MEKSLSILSIPFLISPKIFCHSSVGGWKGAVGIINNTLLGCRWAKPTYCWWGGSKYFINCIARFFQNLFKFSGCLCSAYQYECTLKFIWCHSNLVNAHAGDHATLFVQFGILSYKHTLLRWEIFWFALLARNLFTTGGKWKKNLTSA